MTAQSLMKETPVACSVVAVYPNKFAAEGAVRQLHENGFPLDDLSIVGRDFQLTEEPDGLVSRGDYVKAGAETGSLFGGLSGLCIGAGFLVLPGLGLVGVAGPIAAALLASIEGALAGTAVGSLVGALVGWDIPKDRAIKYEEQVKGGKFLVFVRSTPEVVARARSLLVAHGPGHIDLYEAPESCVPSLPPIALRPHVSETFDRPIQTGSKEANVTQRLADNLRHTDLPGMDMPETRIGKWSNPKMNADQLIGTASTLIAGDKGLLAMDESTTTCDKRFARLAIPQTEESRRSYRELLVTTPGLSECISGAILFDETIRQRKKDGTPFIKVLIDAGIIPGVKVDTGAKAMASHPGEKITEGLDGLRGRLKEYYEMGARFAKWRAVLAIGDGIPSRGCIEANAQALARYAALCQENGLVPVVEPEVLMDGEHSMERCAEVTDDVLRTVFNHLNNQRVMLEGMILKPNMVLPGLTCPGQERVDEVADATVRTLLRAVPAAVPGIAFLSGGQSALLASARLNAMNVRFKSRRPWALSFSFGRALQQPALEIWSGKEAHVVAAQKALLHRARCDQAARRGKYDSAMESHGQGK
jgi:fructose-bisphosphate aldolase class I